ncbi:MAG: hypothetical protein ACXVZ2_10345 [Gaiellaceae bacterium]
MRRLAIGTAVFLLAATGCSSHHAAAPVVPAGGQHLVYVAGQDPSQAVVWIANVDGSHAHRLGRGSVAVLTPDGRSVAVRRSDGIYLLSTDGGKVLRRLTERRLRPQAWSPDGQTLIATRTGQLAVLELDAIDRKTGRVRVLDSGSMYGFDFSPNGDEIVYSRAPTVSGQGLCGDVFDLYVAKLAGGAPRRMTRDGADAFPIWGSKGIAFSRFPGGGSVEDCSAPGIWTMSPDGSNTKPVIDRAPSNLAGDGLYGLQPLAWLDDHHILTGIRSDGGNQGAVVDTKSGRLHRLPDYADEASSDGRFVVGSGNDVSGVHLAIYGADGHRIYLRRNACCPDWNR